jgi:hypothetical protein
MTTLFKSPVVEQALNMTISGNIVIIFVFIFFSFLLMALVHLIDNDYRIAMLNIESKELSMMSDGTLDDSPYFSPNGDMIIFSFLLVALHRYLQLVRHPSSQKTLAHTQLHQPHLCLYLQ